MLIIRFFRTGKKNQPAFKIVVTDRRKPPRAGRFVEEVGFYNPLTKEKVLKSERIKYWLSVGAKPSDTVFNLLVSENIVEGKKMPVHKKAKKKKETAPAEEFVAADASASAETPTEKPAVEEKPAEEVQVEETKATEEKTEEGKTEKKTEELPKKE